LPEDRSPRRRPKTKRQEIQLPTGTLWRIVVAALPLLFVAVGSYFLLRSSLLTVQHVQVVGTETLDNQSLIEIAGLSGRSMIDLPEDELRSRLLEVPQVKSVTVSRHWPQTVVLKIHERQPVAIWSVSGRDYMVDSEGVVLASGGARGPVPRIVEPQTDRVMGPGDRVHPDAIAFARKIYEQSPKFLNQSVKELEYRAGVGVTAVFSNDMRVTFGDERAYDYKVAVLSKLLDQLAAKKYAPRAVDLRFGERVTYE
jgi:cell division protein FtsQ